MKLIGVLAFISLASCGQPTTSVQKPVKVSTPRQTVTKAPKPVPVYTSTPSWSIDREAKISTKLGDLRVFNAGSGYEIDLALVGEIFDRHVHTTKLEKALELRVFPEKYVIPGDQEDWFDLTNDEVPGIELAVTLEPENSKIIPSVLPVGWATDMKVGENACSGRTIRGQAEMFLTLAAIHELVGHGTRRAALVPKTSNEECEAQELEDQVYDELAGRVAFRKVAPK